jgi:hypothetical protein
MGFRLPLMPKTASILRVHPNIDWCGLNGYSSVCVWQAMATTLGVLVLGAPRGKLAFYFQLLVYYYMLMT